MPVETTLNMGLSDESEDNLHVRYEEICLDLNLDKSAKDEAWEAYNRISVNYTLEVGVLIQLWAAIFVLNTLRPSII